MADEVNVIELTIEVVSSYVGRSNVRAEDVPSMIANIHSAISALNAPAEPEPAASEAQPEHKGAVTARKSLASPDHIISMIDGKPYKTLRRHLTRHGLTPDEYRECYGLKKDYPMVAQTYSEARRTMAKALGLGQKAVQKVEAVVGLAAPAAEAPKRRGRKPKGAEAQGVASKLAYTLGRRGFVFCHGCVAYGWEAARPLWDGDSRKRPFIQIAVSQPSGPGCRRPLTL